MSAPNSISVLGRDEKLMILVNAIRLHDFKLAEDIIFGFIKDKQHLSVPKLQEILQAQPPRSITSRLLENPSILLRTWSHEKFILNYLIKLDTIEALVPIMNGQIVSVFKSNYRAAAAQVSIELVRVLKSGKQWTPFCFWHGLIPTRPDPESETFTLECFQIFNPIANEVILRRALLKVAENCRSIQLAQFLIQKGANVGYKQESNSRHRPLLYLATAKYTPEWKQFAKFLIQRGADTKAMYKANDMQDTRVGRNVQKWTGMSWNESVADALNGGG